MILYIEQNVHRYKIILFFYIPYLINYNSLAIKCHHFFLF